MKALILITPLMLVISACSNKPNLYSPVLPMEDGSMFTSTTASTKDKALIRATRNAERYCEHLEKTHIIISMNNHYEGLLESEEADKKAKQATAIASKLTLGVIKHGTSTDYRTELAFKCK